jgi:hypothetical protein
MQPNEDTPPRPIGPRGAGRYRPQAGFKTIIPALHWWAIFEGEQVAEQPLVCWALIGGSVVGMTLTYDGDGVSIPEEVNTFLRYEYRP